MIAETLAGIALVKSAVDGIKSAIGTANDIGDIAGYIDNLFEGEKQVQHIRNKKAGSVSIGDQFGVDTVARDVIDALRLRFICLYLYLDLPPMTLSYSF